MNKLIVIKEPQSLEEKASQLAELELAKKEIMQKITEWKAELLTYMQEKGVLGLKLEAYTLSRAKRITPQIESFKTLKETLDKENIPYETEEVFTDQTKVMFKEAIRQGRLLKGLTALETEYVTIRVKKPEGKEVKNGKE